VLHKDRVKARIVRHDRKGRAEGRVVEIVERPPQPIIGRLLQRAASGWSHRKTSATARTC
jgi:ribonuclease R